MGWAWPGLQDGGPGLLHPGVPASGHAFSFPLECPSFSSCCQIPPTPDPRTAQLKPQFPAAHGSPPTSSILAVLPCWDSPHPQPSPSTELNPAWMLVGRSEPVPACCPARGAPWAGLQACFSRPSLALPKVSRWWDEALSVGRDRTSSAAAPLSSKSPCSP